MTELEKQLMAALKELVIDMKIAQGNMRIAAIRDPKWEGCAEAIQPRVDAADAAIATAEAAQPVAVPESAATQLVCDALVAIVSNAGDPAGTIAALDHWRKKAEAFASNPLAATAEDSSAVQQPASAQPVAVPEPGTTEYGSWINTAQQEASQNFSLVTEKFRWLCAFEQALRAQLSAAKKPEGVE